MVRFGILGFGLHATKRLVGAFGLAKNARLVALSRRDLKHAKASAEMYGVPLAFDSPEELCRSSEVDAVFIATPNACHLQHVLLALKCGKPVLCEKPMGVDAKQCQQMVEAAREANLLLGVAQVFRFADAILRLRERISARAIGRPMFARCEFCYSANTHPRRWINDIRLAGGGPIADVGVHCVDALRFILDDEVTAVHASASFSEEAVGLETSAVVTLEFRSKTLAVVHVSSRSPYQTPLEFIGDAGSMRVEDGFSVDREVCLELKKGNTVLESEPLSNHLAHSRQLDAFAAALQGGPPFSVPGDEGWRDQLVLDAAYRSLKSRQMESVPSPESSVDLNRSH